MLIINFVPQKLSTYELKNIKRGLRNYFEYADGAQCHITSLFFSEKLMSGQGALDNLYGADTISEKLFDMEFLVSPRAYFCINTRGAETLIDTIERLANLHKNMTLLDICCGTGIVRLWDLQNLSRWLNDQSLFPIIVWFITYYVITACQVYSGLGVKILIIV